MKCPICNVDLRMAERHEVEIDYCPQCRGVWLDRGELQKIIAHVRRQENEDPLGIDPAPRREPPRRDDERRYEGKKDKKKKKKKKMGLDIWDALESLID